jgi:hypothetical protein
MTVATTNTNQPVSGRVVYTPSRSGNVPTTQGPTYSYTRTVGGTGGASGGGTSAPRRWAARIEAEPRRVPTRNGIPSFLGSRTVLMGSWAVAMAIVTLDEWKNNGIFPRPARLWSTTLFYGLLALASMVEVIVPIVNALAIGYTFTLLWNYFNKQGQFS